MRAVPRLCVVYPDICLTTEDKARKNLSHGSRRVPAGTKKIFSLACTKLGVCTVTIAGWSSNSAYSLLGGLHALAQTISYEVRLAFVLLSFVVLIYGYNLAYFYSLQV